LCALILPAANPACHAKNTNIGVLLQQMQAAKEGGDQAAPAAEEAATSSTPIPVHAGASAPLAQQGSDAAEQA
jgi:hypothetical protein